MLERYLHIQRRVGVINHRLDTLLKSITLIAIEIIFGDGYKRSFLK